MYKGRNRRPLVIDYYIILQVPVIKINGGSMAHITKVWDQDITTI